MPDHPGSFTIECDPCGAGLIDDDKETVIARWNRRATDAERDALKADNELMWDVRELGRAIYLGLYEHQGADWNANETQSVWYDVAARALAVLHRDEPTKEAP